METVFLKNKTVLVTGTAGFIGANLVLELMKSVESIHIVGIDNMNDYYDVSIKEYRLQQIDLMAKTKRVKWTFIRGDIADKALMDNLFCQFKPSVVVNLAAQAGVRYSITHPDVYIQSNIIGFYNLLEACRHSYDNGERGVEHFVYASSSSVYGSNKKIPYATEDKVDNPVSLYAATKKSNELLAHAYSKLYNIPSTGLRFFTVYGPAGRPDMAYFDFTKKLCAKEKSLIMAIASVILHMWMTLSRGSYWFCRALQNEKTARTDCRFRHMQYIISETIDRKICWILWIYYSRNWCVQECCRKIMILINIRNWSLCNREMSPLHMRTHRRWSAIMDLNPIPLCVRDYVSLLSGIKNFINRS